MPAAENTDLPEPSPEDAPEVAPEVAPETTEAAHVLAEEAAISPVIDLDVGELSTHHDDLENPDAELSDSLSVDSLSMTTFKMQPRIN